MVDLSDYFTIRAIPIPALGVPEADNDNRDQASTLSTSILLSGKRRRMW